MSLFFQVCQPSVYWYLRETIQSLKLWHLSHNSSFVCGYIFLMRGPKNIMILSSANYVHSWVFLQCSGEPECFYFFLYTTEKWSVVFFWVSIAKIIQIMEVLVKEHMLYVLWKCYINASICKNYSAEWFLLYLIMYNSNPCELYELCFYMVCIHKSFESYIILFHVFKTIVIIISYSCVKFSIH